MYKEIIECDYCDKDITKRDNNAMPQNYLTLRESPRLPEKEQGTYFEYAISAHNELERSKHFCDLSCLIRWLRYNRAFFFETVCHE